MNATIIILLAAIALLLFIAPPAIILATNKGEVREKIENAFHKEILKRMKSQNLYALVNGPECEKLMSKPGFQIQAIQVNPKDRPELKSAYLVPVSLLDDEPDHERIYVRHDGKIPATGSVTDHYGNIFVPAEKES